MKKICFLLLIFCFCSTADIGAQNIASIRERYSTVKDMISYQQKDDNMKNCSIITYSQIVPGTGPQTCSYTAYFTPLENDAEGNLKAQKLQFVQCSYNIAAGEYYEEYLYDRFGDLIFILKREPGEDGKVLDTQVYLSRGEVLKMAVNEVDGDKEKLLYSGKAYNNDPQYMQPVIDKANSFAEAFSSLSSAVNAGIK